MKCLKSKFVRKTLQIIFILGSFFFLGKRLYSHWQEARQVLFQVDWAVFSIAFLVLLLSYLFRPLGFLCFSRGGFQAISYQQSGRAYFLSQLTKYLPGGIWVFPSRVVLLSEMGIDVGFSSLGLAFESVAMLLSSLFVGLTFFAQGLPSDSWLYQARLPALLGGFGFAVLLVVLPELVAKVRPAWMDKMSYLAALGRVSLKNRVLNLVWAVLVYGLMWIVTGISFYGLILALGADKTDLPFFATIGLFSLSWAGGFISVFNPGGVGIREAILTVSLGKMLVEPIPVLASIFSRLLWIIAEVLYFAVFLYFVNPQTSSEKA